LKILRHAVYERAFNVKNESRKHARHRLLVNRHNSRGALQFLAGVFTRKDIRLRGAAKRRPYQQARRRVFAKTVLCGVGDHHDNQQIRGPEMSGPQPNLPHCP
jgi:hypothetical protein